MLRLMLDAHPDLAIAPESHFIPSVFAVKDRYATHNGLDAERLVGDIMRTTRFRDWKIPEDAVLLRVGALAAPGFADVVDAVFMAYADAQGKSRWGDQTPGYVLDMALLGDLFPDARFIHLLRDGRDVALSLMQVAWGPRRLSEAAEVWAHRVRAGRASGKLLGADRYREVRYEALVDDHEAELRAICPFLELEYRPEMLRYLERGVESIPARERRHHAHEGEPPTRGLRDWRRDMPPEKLALFEAIAGRELNDLGYERAYDQIPLSARMRAGEGRVTDRVSRTARRLRHRAARAVRRDALPPPRRW